MLEIKDLYHSYEKDKEVLRNIGLTIKPGEFVGVIGPNGCGKSTLINLICRILEAQRGSIKLNGTSIAELRQAELARQIALVPQDSSFEFDFTALEIVLMGRLPFLERFQLEGAGDRKIAKDAMMKTSCWKFRDKYIKNLSGGEKQRVIVARALTQQPKYLLLDEPTAHLDLNFQYEILDILTELNRKKNVTVISVFHDINHASRYCSRLVMMNDGEIISDGPPDAVLNKKNLARIYDFNIILKRHPVDGYTYILPDITSKPRKGPQERLGPRIMEKVKNK